MDIERMKQQLLELVQKYHYQLAITDLQPSIRLKTRPRGEDFITLRASKIGGFPDLPEGLIWPEIGR